MEQAAYSPDVSSVAVAQVWLLPPSHEERRLSWEVVLERHGGLVLEEVAVALHPLSS